jgi:hypothetical protein
LVQWGKVGQSPKLLLHVRVDPDRAGESATTVHDAVTDDVGTSPIADQLIESTGAGPGGAYREFGMLFEDVPVQQTHFHAGRAGVDDHHAHALSPDPATSSR